jgi:K+:H+ antiporter
VVVASIAIALAAALVLAAVGRRLAVALGQPGVLGQIVVGLAFGAVAGTIPDLRSALFPPAAEDSLLLVGSVGVCTYLIRIGRDLGSRGLPGSGTPVVQVALPAAVVSIAAGIAAAAALTAYKPAAAPGGAFALFIGVTICVTALPVLARILEEGRLLSEPLAAIALACALLTDVIAGVLLTASVVWADDGSVARVLLAVAVFPALLAVGSALRTIMGVVDRLGDPWRHAGALPLVVAFAVVIVGVARVGVPFIVPAFVIGATMGQSRTADELATLSASVARVGLPVFFVYTGVRTSFSDATALTLLALAGGLTLLAWTAKAAGTLIGAWRAGLGFTTGAALALLLNTRGVTELVVLNVGLDAHLIGPTLFSAFVVMAVATTVATGAALGRVAAAAGRRGSSGSSAKAAAAGRPPLSSPAGE